MEILHKFKENGYFTSELYHLLAKKKLVDPAETIIPSEYEREMKMTTQQRLQSLNAIMVDNIVNSGREPQKIVLSFSPRIIVFQNFKANEKIVAKFSVKNISQAPTYIKMECNESPYFFVKPCCGQLLSRLAPGMGVTFAVTFVPVQFEDYIHSITFNTDMDQYYMPLIGMAPRPVFDFPDEVIIPRVPLKMESYVFVTVRNIGYMPAAFTFNTRCPFSIQPLSGFLNVNDKMDFKIIFKTMNLGEIRGILYAMFETGEKFIINLISSTYTVSIELEKQVVRFLDTYNTMVRQLTFKIINKSNHILTYMCMKNESVYYDFEDKIKLATIFYNTKESESKKYMKLVYYDVLSSDEHERVYTRIFFDEIQALVADESLLFNDTHFSIIPIKGQLWPNKATEITITFSPKEIGELNAIAYLDIDGVMDRIPLKIIGTSLPPSINLNLETLNMDSIYINKTYNYEIIAINKGHINGVIVYKEIPTLFGSKISCKPEMHCLRPGEKETFIISFCNSNQGPFFEEISFIIRETDIILKLYLKGEVIYPSLTFSLPCLDFGLVSLGVPKTLELEVINESMVDVSVTIKISSDGPEISSVTLEDYAVADKPKPKVPQWPREFNIDPSKNYIQSESRFTIKVTLTANLIRTHKTSLELELEKSDGPPVILPVLFNAMVPTIIPAPNIVLRGCFIDFSYTNEITIVSNGFWGYFTLEEPEEGNTLEVTVGVKEGIIQPDSTISLPVSIKTSVLGVQQFPLRLLLFGLSKPLDICHITACGVRPIVTCTPMELHWGEVKLLMKSQKVLTLCNDSPVYVNFKASVLNKDGRWQIQPSEGYIEPESRKDFVLNLYLIDADTYMNKAVLQLEKVKDILVPLTATGVGTSIVVGELRDRIVLGRHFTKIPFNCKVIMENYGTKMHSLEWSEHYKASKTKQSTPTGFFSLDPKVFKMAAGEKLELTITGLSHKVTTVKELWYLVGSIEGINKKELLLECEIQAEFVDAKIELSFNVLDLQYDYGPYNEYYKLTDIITIKNVSKLPLDIELSVKPPFGIIQRQSTYKILPEEENLCCCICYNESDLNVSNIVKKFGPVQSTVFIDYLTLKPVEPLRKGSLHFFQDIHKIKMAFNLVHSVEERLEDLDVMKLQVLFDTTKHLSLKSSVYYDLMRIKFKGHKNKDAVKLIGKINFPNIYILPPRVNFQCILNGSLESKTIKLQNITPLLVCYKFQWKNYTITANVNSEITKTKSYNKCIEVESPSEDMDVPGFLGLNEIQILPNSTATNIENVSENKDIGKEVYDLDTEIKSAVLDYPELNHEFWKLKTLKKVAPMIVPDYQPEFNWVWKFPKIELPHSVSINDLIKLTPHRGMLKPNEIQYVDVIFKPDNNINVRAVLECEVLGGPSESIIITGQSSDVMYKMNTHKLNFKTRSFHEHATEELALSNTALLPFEYKTYLNEPKFDNELQATIVEIEPAEKNLHMNEEIHIKIVVRPGVVGYFNRIFFLEIGHLPHIPIEVFGWGVIPQVYLTLPRPEIINLHPELGYLAIPVLTLDYLEAVSEIFAKTSSDHLNSPLTEKCFEDPNFQHDWHICSSWDGYPSTMDIELAIERMLVIDHIKLRPELLVVYSTTSKMGPIQGFQTTPYVVDYGVVITGSMVQCSAEIINYGPIPTKLHFAKGTIIPSWLEIKLCGKLLPGETGKIDILFSPTSDDFTKQEQDVQFSFNLEVPYGVSIPIRVKALCAVPYLVSNISEVDFGSVRCGNKIVCSIPLKNVGKPTCIWYVTLRLKVPGPNPMTILESSGKFGPEEGGWLSIAFKPTMEMTYEGILIFRFHMNPNRLIIPVTGKGLIPQVRVIGSNVNFPPTLPWTKTTDIYFGLTNPCPFPIELIIAHSDEKWKEEEDIYQLLYKYYNKPEEMLVPAIRPGEGMPIEIINFYKKYNERVAKAIAEEAAAAKLASAKETTVKKLTKIPKTAAKAPSTKESTPRKFRTEAEILADEIQILKENHVDPLQECLYVFDNIHTNSETDKHLKGIIIFVHGSPCEEMQCQEMAYTFGKELDIPTVNIDLCIVEALCLSECPAKVILINALNESYNMSLQHSQDDTDFHDDNKEEVISEDEDEFDTIFKKIKYLASNNNVGTSKKDTKKKKRSPNTSMGSHTALAAMGSTTMFHMDLVQELLTDHFNQAKFDKGFVVDTLTSMIVKNPPLLLTTVLKCKHNIWNIHLVLCQSDFHKWAQAFEESQRENELINEIASKVYDKTEIDEIIQSVEDMTDEEYENYPQELKLIYINYGLEERRQKHLSKLGQPSENVQKGSEKDTNRSKLVPIVEGLDSKKKITKEDIKGKPPSEYQVMNAKYNEYIKNTYENLINIANNWVFQECDVGTPLYGFNGQIVGAMQKKAKKKSEIQIQMSDNTYSERGFPLTITTCPCLHYKKALVTMFKNSTIVQKALKDEECYNILKYPIIRKEFTVLMPKTFPLIQHEASLRWRYLDEMPIKKCECNPITDLNLLDDSTQDNVLNILAKWHCTCGKMVTSSQTSTSEIPFTSVEKIIEDKNTDTQCPLSLQRVKSVTSITGRLVLLPDDLVRCKFSFNPQNEGNFALKRFVEVSYWPKSRVDINVTGICDLPRIDSRPKKMFENFARRTIENTVYNTTYLDDLKVFEFGPIFMGKYRIYEEQYTINLKNSSLITCDIEIEFLEDTTVFEIDKTFIKLEPGSKDKLTIKAAPAEFGIHTCVLLFCVKDNPEIVTVNVGCTGVVPIVEILPLTQTIDYGKLLLYRREDDRFIVKNDSILPILWKIRNAQDFIEDFIIAQTSGIVQRYDNQVVAVTYIACRVDVISNKMVIIDIYDAKARGDPMIVSNLYLSAECYDVMVDCAYENPSENFLNYGNVKINSTVYREMYFLNRGKYNVYFKLKKVKNFPEPSLLRSFEVSQECGIIPPTLKLLCLEFECTPSTSVNLVNVPAYICSLLDGSKNQVVVAKFPVCVTIGAYYNTFTLFPLGELNFHVIPVGSGVTKEVILNNTSKCPITYEIVLPEEYQPDSDHPQIAMKGKENKIKNPPMKCGNFLIMNDDNLLAPGTSRAIQIQFMATAERKFEEIIKFIVSDTCPAEAEGVPLKLVGTGAMPTLDIWNIETTFREHLIVKNLSEYKDPESFSHCVFVENSATFHFFCVTVGSSFTGNIDLYNNGLVACVLTMRLNYNTNSNPSIFSLDKYETHIEPLMHKNLGIVFSPKSLIEYRAVLEIKLKLQDKQEKSFKICLIGEGVIPRICLVSPPIRQYRIALLEFPVTCLGSVSVKPICFKNISSVKTMTEIEVLQTPFEGRPIFWVTAAANTVHAVMSGSNDEMNVIMKVTLKPEEIATILVHYNPKRKGRQNCDVKLTITDNPYEYFAILCEAEAFMEDVILIGLEMLSMDTDLEAYKTTNERTMSIISTTDSRKKSRSAPLDKNKSKQIEARRSKRISRISMKQSDTNSLETSVLKYILDFGGCELCSLQTRSVVMVNNSDKVYKFSWEVITFIIIKPSVGYISPGEEKSMEIMFLSMQPVALVKELLTCSLVAISDDTFNSDMKSLIWDNRQLVTVFDHNSDISKNERCEVAVAEQQLPPDVYSETITMIVVYSATVEFTKYSCTLKEEITLLDTFIYQTRCFSFNVQNIGKVPMKIYWNFSINEEFPGRIDKYKIKEVIAEEHIEEAVPDPCSCTNDLTNADQTPAITEEKAFVVTNYDGWTFNDNPFIPVPSKITLFSGSTSRNSVDTWFESDLPFTIKPDKDCIKPGESQEFKVTFAPLEAFDYSVRLRSCIDNLDPYDQNISCRISAKSLIPYCHLDIEESDYLTSGRRKTTGVALPPHLIVLEFNVLGSGCHKKCFNVINPTSEAYEFIFEMVMSDKPELIPVHCDTLKGYIEGGTSTKVTFSFAPTASGIYESLWKCIIPVHNLTMNLMVVGFVREPDVVFVPTILLIRNSLVGFTSNNIVVIKNNETESLKFEVKGNSLRGVSGKTPVIVEPNEGVLKARSETPIKIIYTPIEDGPLSFKIFCSITYLTKYLTLCVNTLSYSIKPKVSYYLIGNEHILNSDVITNIHLDQTSIFGVPCTHESTKTSLRLILEVLKENIRLQDEGLSPEVLVTASTYERAIPFTIKNDGSATFFFNWYYSGNPVKKYMTISVEPKSGHVTPGQEVECIVYFTIKQVPVVGFPIKLDISDGPEYNVTIHADIEKPAYHFSCKEYDFGKCIINAPNDTYKKNMAFTNDDKVPVIVDLHFTNLPELFVDYHQEPSIAPGKRVKVPIYFRPKQVKEYEFKLQFWVNSLCEEIITVKGEGVPLLFDLYEGCQKSFDLGPVKVGEKKVRTVEVMNHSKVPIEASFVFREMHPIVEDTSNSDITSICLNPSVTNMQADTGPSRVKMLKHYKDDLVRQQIAMDIENALLSLKVVPNMCTIKPYRKVPLKIQFKPVGMIKTLDVQLNMKVFEFERPLVKLSGSATGMSFCLSQNSLQFGQVRKRACKILKVMLQNKGDFGARFWWQPLISDEFTISPLKGNIAAHTNVTFTITFRPHNHNPFIKVWASCNIENYIPLELAMYAACIDTGNVQNKTLYIECPVREIKTDYVVVTNSSDDLWYTLSEVSGGPFDTLKEFHVKPNSTFAIPVNFKPKTIGKHEAEILYSPLGESALFVTLIGTAAHPNPNGTINITIAAKIMHTEELQVYNITEFPESYAVSTELVKIIPDKFEGYYEIKYPETVKVWGEAAATCRWTYVCYEQCEMHMKVMFINEETREYQFYDIIARVTPSQIVDTLTFVSRARESLQKELAIANPLSNDADFYIKCEKLICPNMLRISRNSEATLAMTYSPLVVGETEDYLEVNNNLVGTYVYKLVLKCLPAKEKNLEFTTELGNTIPIRLRVHNRTEAKTEFKTSVSHPSIQLEKEYTLGPSERGKFLVWFEPTELSVQNCQVSFNSLTAGEFLFNITGIATEPKPCGPYEIKAGGYITITLKNIFEDLHTFKIYVDREDFYVKTLYEQIKPKKDLAIMVYLNERPLSGWPVMPTGTLTIENYDPSTPKVHWTYFLRGVP